MILKGFELYSADYYEKVFALIAEISDTTDLATWL